MRGACDTEAGLHFPRWLQDMSAYSETRTGHSPRHKAVLWLVFVHFVRPSFCLVRTIYVCPGVAGGQTKAFVAVKGKLDQLPSHEVSPKSVPLPPSHALFLCASQVYIHIPGAKKLTQELPLVIGTTPYSGFGSRNSSVASQFSMDMSWLALTLPEQPEGKTFMPSTAKFQIETS